MNWIHIFEWKDKKNTVPLKLLTVVGFSLLDHMDKVIGQDERHTLPIDPKFPLKVTQEMPKVNVEQLKKKVKTVKSCSL